MYVLRACAPLWVVRCCPSIPVWPDKNKEHPNWATDFADFCDPNVCLCDVIERMAVGREFPHFGIPYIPGTPKPQCSTDFYTIPNYKNYNKSSLLNSTKNVTLADCCSMCTSLNTEAETVCGSYTFEPELDHSENKRHRSSSGMATLANGSRKVGSGGANDFDGFDSFDSSSEGGNGYAAIPTGPGTCNVHGVTPISDFGPVLFGVSGYFRGMGTSAFVEQASGELSEVMNGTWCVRAWRACVRVACVRACAVHRVAFSLT